MKNKNLIPINGKWVVGNLNDKLVAASFDKFINMNRQPIVEAEPRVKRNLSHHNYKFTERPCY